MLVAWLLEKNYNASLTSMMTVQQLQPTVSDMNELIKNGEYVGYQDGSFVKDLLKSLNFAENRLRNSSPEQYADALSNGSWNGGVAAIFDEIPYLKPFLSEHCNKYDMVGRIYKTGGFGFVFPKGSPLVPDISRGILNVTEGDKIVDIERKWFGDQVACSGERSKLDYATLDFHSFRGVFYITIALWGIVLLIFAAITLNKKKDVITAALSEWHRQKKGDEPPRRSNEAIATVRAPQETMYIDFGPQLEIGSSSWPSTPEQQ